MIVKEATRWQIYFRKLYYNIKMTFFQELVTGAVDLTSNETLFDLKWTLLDGAIRAIGCGTTCNIMLNATTRTSNVLMMTFPSCT